MKLSGYIVLYGLVVVGVVLIPDSFLAFMFGFVGVGMVAINAGEQIRRDRERRRAA